MKPSMRGHLTPVRVGTRMWTGSPAGTRGREEPRPPWERQVVQPLGKRQAASQSSALPCHPSVPLRAFP